MCVSLCCVGLRACTDIEDGYNNDYVLPLVLIKMYYANINILFYISILKVEIAPTFITTMILWAQCMCARL